MRNLKWTEQDFNNLEQHFRKDYSYLNNKSTKQKSLLKEKYKDVTRVKKNYYYKRYFIVFEHKRQEYLSNLIYSSKKELYESLKEKCVGISKEYIYSTNNICEKEPIKGYILYKLPFNLTLEEAKNLFEKLKFDISLIRVQVSETNVVNIGFHSITHLNNDTTSLDIVPFFVEKNDEPSIIRSNLMSTGIDKSKIRLIFKDGIWRNIKEYSFFDDIEIKDAKKENYNVLYKKYWFGTQAIEKEDLQKLNIIETNQIVPVHLPEKVIEYEFNQEKFTFANYYFARKINLLEVKKQGEMGFIKYDNKKMYYSVRGQNGCVANFLSNEGKDMSFNDFCDLWLFLVRQDKLMLHMFFTYNRTKFLINTKYEKRNNVYFGNVFYAIQEYQKNSDSKFVPYRVAPLSSNRNICSETKFDLRNLPNESIVYTYYLKDFP